jgi:hypothetical protein
VLTAEVMDAHDRFDNPDAVTPHPYKASADNGEWVLTPHQVSRSRGRLAHGETNYSCPAGRGRHVFAESPSPSDSTDSDESYGNISFA